MGTRQDAMSQIDTMLLSEPKPARRVVAKVAPANPAPHAAPDPVKLLRAEIDQQRADTEREHLERSDTLAQEKQEFSEQQARTAAVQQALSSVGATLRSMFRSNTSKLEGISIPGGVYLPLAILLVLVVVLLPVGGHTRLGWLWMTITGNARIGAALPTPTISTPVSAFQGATGNPAGAFQGAQPTMPQGSTPPPALQRAHPAPPSLQRAGAQSVNGQITAAIGGGPSSMINYVKLYGSEE